MKNILLLLFLAMGTLSFAKSTSQTVEQIIKDHHATNNYKNYEVTTADDNDKSSEGGVIEYYSRNGELKKVVTKYYGESGKSITEYYVKNNNVYFVYDADYHYNVPSYIDKTFDKKKTEIKEKRYYFDSDGNLIRYIDENKKIIEDKKKLHYIQEEIHKNIEEVLLKNKTHKNY